ncbi:hypothetical protein BGZ46_009438 [Entomortierella lignicola]|nr:hypothetical protein BGZ46_009438 [Entomortierella lignicola]
MGRHIDDDLTNWDDTSSSIEEIAIIRQATNALEAYEHKSGCFKNAARALRQNCKHIDIDSDEKTKYNFRILQRNMTRYHAEQIDLLRKHQNELMEKHRLETERLQEVLNVHSTIIREMKSVESLVGSFHHSLSSVIDNISNLKQKSEEIVQQNVALSDFQGMEMSLLAERHSELEVIDNSNNSGVARIASSRPNIRPRVDWTKPRTYGNFITMLRT